MAKNKGGRPTKYNKQMVEKTKAYFDNRKEKGQVPFIEELAIELGVSKETVYQWEKQKDKKEFSDVLKRIRDLQEVMLQKAGLSKQANPAVAIFLLKCKHGYVETSRQEITGKDGGPIDINSVLDKIDGSTKDIVKD